HAMGFIAFDWWQVIEELRLPRWTESAVRDLPAIGHDFEKWAIEVSPSAERLESLNAALSEATDLEYRAWIARVDALILAYGHDEVRKIFIRSFELAERRYTTTPNHEAHVARVQERIDALGLEEAGEAAQRMRDSMTGRMHKVTKREMQRRDAAAAGPETDETGEY